MRKLIYFIQVFCFLLVSLNDSYGEWVPFSKSAEKMPSIKILSSDATSITFEISLFGMEMIEKSVENKKYHVLKIPDYYTTLEIGKPQLPALRELIGVPDFSSYEISMLDSNVITLSNYNIYPFQKPLLEGELGEFTIDESIYKNDSFYPMEMVKIDKPAIMRDIRVSRISLFPFKFNPSTKEVKVFQKMVVKVNFKDVTGMSSPIIYKGVISNQWKKVYENSVLNFSNLHLESNKYGNVNKIMTGEVYDYLIITHQDYFDAIGKLASWKTRKGLLSKVVKLNDIGGNNATTIKEYIQDEYDEHHISYVLLVGDQSQLSMLGSGDYNYSLLGYFLDCLPEIAIGRLSVTSVAEVEHAIDKCIDYEMYLPNITGVNKVLLVSHKETEFIVCSEGIRSDSYSDSPIFTPAYGTNIVNGYVTTQINSGYGVVNYLGHGENNCWSEWNINDENYTTTDVRALDNSSIKPIVFSIACLNSELDNSTGTETLAESFIKTDNGATAFLGATRESYTIPNETYAEELFIQTFNTAVNRIGLISNNAAVKMIDYFETEGPANARMYLWLGDPSLEMWTNTIQQFTNVQITDNGTSITVNTGITGSDICVSSSNNGDDYYEVATNEASHTFTGITSTDRPLYITVTKHNYTPSVSVTSGTFTANQVWFSNMVVIGNITVASGVTLTIDEGTNLTFQNSSALKVFGTLNVNGASSNKVTFDFVSPNSYNGIKFYSGSSGTVDNAIINDAYYGIYVSSVSPTIENCEISDCTYGIYTTYASPDIETNEIHDVYRGIYTYLGSPTITDNYIYDASDYGMLVNASDTYIRENTIKNCKGGIWAYGNQTIKLHGYGKNEIVGYESGGHAVYVTGGTAHLGEYSSRGYNSFIRNTLNTVVYNSSTNEVLAEKNYWGGSPSSSWFYGDVEWSFPLSSESGGVGSTLDLSKAIAPDLTPDRILFSNAISLADIDEHKEASKKFKELIKDYPDSRFAGLSVAWAMASDKKEKEFKDQTDYLKSLKDHTNKKVRDNHFIWLASLEASNGDIEASKLVVNSTPIDEPVGVEIRLNLANDMLNLYNDEQGAEVIFNELLAAGATESTLQTINVIRETAYNTGNIDFGEGNIKYEAGENIEISESTLSNAYPNPFNPSATISYQIPKDGFVNLVVYNILGQVVSTLVNEHQTTGKYSVQFNASSLPSGVYIYKFHAGEFSSVKKMLLTK